MQIDPYATTNALGRGFDMARGMAENRAQRRAGNALASGDRQGAMNALGGAGMLGEVEALAQNDRQAQQAERQASAARQDEMRQFLLRAGTALRTAPMERRQDVYRMLRPTLEQIYDPEVISQLDRTDLSDANLDSLLSALGGETQRFNTSGAVIEVGPGGGVRTLYETERHDDAPNGYRWTEDGSLEPIPGGPADPRQVGSIASSRRAPPRSSGGGGSRSSGGSSGASRPAAPAPRSGTGALPPGFTVRRR